MNALKKLWVYSCWGASAVKSSLGDRRFWEPTFIATMVGVIFPAVLYIAEGGSRGERNSPRNYTDFAATEFNLVSGVELPKDICPDLEGFDYYAAKNEAGEYVLLERKDGESTLEVLRPSYQQKRLDQITACLDEAVELNAEELAEFGWQFSFTDKGTIYGPIKMHDTKENKVAIKYDYTANSYESFSSLERKAEEVQKYLLVEGMELLSANKLSNTWKTIASEVSDKGFADYKIDELPEVKYASGSWAELGQWAMIGGSAGLLLGGGLGLAFSSGANGAARREKYQSKLNAIGRDVIM